MKKVLTEEYGKAYAAEIMKKSKQVYRELVEQADDIGDDDPHGIQRAVRSGLRRSAV